MRVLQQFIDQLQDFGGQQFAKSAQIVWDFFVSLLHIFVMD